MISVVVGVGGVDSDSDGDDEVGGIAVVNEAHSCGDIDGDSNGNDSDDGGC